MDWMKYQCTECEKVHDTHLRARNCHPGVGGVRLVDTYTGPAELVTPDVYCLVCLVDHYRMRTATGASRGGSGVNLRRYTPMESMPVCDEHGPK